MMKISSAFALAALAGIAAFAFESGKSLLLERETCESLAAKNKISVTTVS